MVEMSVRPFGLLGFLGVAGVWSGQPALLALLALFGLFGVDRTFEVPAPDRLPKQIE
jgi:hypothetical protein